MGTTEQQYCLKWNNHNSTLLSVFDHLLEEESLVDCTLYADGQYLKAHKIILSACSPYLRGMFNAVDPANPTNQIIHLVGIDFENLKSLVEYMYKGEANVPLHMLSSFIRAGESLKIKGLEVSATKQLEADGSTPNSQPTTVLPTPSSLASLTPTSMPSVSAATSLSHIFNGSKDATPSKKRSREAAQAAAAQAAAAQALANSALANSTLGGDAFGGGILAQRLASQPLLNITPEMLLARTSLANIPSQNPLQIPHPPPPMKKSRKSAEPKSTNANNLAFPLNFPLTGIPPQPLPLNFLPNMMQTPSNKSSRKKDKGASSGHGSAVTSTPVNNNNYESEGDEGVLKIDEEADAGKENRVGSISAASPASNKHAMIDDDIVDLEGESNGISTEDDEEEEPSMPGPGGAADMGHTQSGILNPWTGEPIHLSEDHDDNSAPDDSGLVGWPATMLREFSGGGGMSTSLAHTLCPPPSLTMSMVNTNVHHPLPPSTTTTGHSNNHHSTLSTIQAHGSMTSNGRHLAEDHQDISSREPEKNLLTKTASSLRLKRLNSAAQSTVYSVVTAADGAVKFRCMACSRIFNLKCTLLRHVRHQHQGRFVPHPCGQCGQVFKRTDHLKVHMRKIHNMTSSTKPRNGSASINSDSKKAESGDEGLSPAAGDLTTSSAVVAAAVASMASTQPVPVSVALDTSSIEEQSPRSDDSQTD